MTNFTCKKSITILIFALLFTPLMHGQVLIGNLTLTTQAEVDAFNYTEVTGYLWIQESAGNNITNLDGLSGLTSLNTLQITRNNALTNLDGLSGLTTLNSTITVEDNPVLNNLCGLYTAMANKPVGFWVDNTNFNVSGNAQNPTSVQLLSNGFCVFNLIPDLPTLPGITEQCEASPAAPTANGGTIIATADVTFPISTQSSTLVTWTYDDGNGNLLTQTQIITVNDTEDPIISCPNNITTDSDIGECGAIVNFDLTASDNCSDPTTLTWEESFQNLATLAQCASWNNYRASLTTLSYSSLTVSGSLDPVGITLTNPIEVANIAAALNSGGSYTFFDGINTWGVNMCGPGTELRVNQPSCNCSGPTTLTRYAVRPCIGIPNWGGIGNGNLATCDNAPNQSLKVEFVVNMAPTVSYVPASGTLFPIGTTLVTSTATDASGNTATCTFDVTVNDIEAPTFDDISVIPLYNNDFENPNISPIQDYCLSDISVVQGINTLYGPGFQQMFTVEAILINGPLNAYSDPTGAGGNYSIGIGNRDENDRLALTFDAQDKDFLNVKFDLSSIDNQPCEVPFGQTIPVMRLRLYDSPNGDFNLNAPGTPLDQVDLTGTSNGATQYTFDWTTVMASLDASGSTDGNVSIEFDLITTAGYASFDNLEITASNVSIEDGCPEDIVVNNDPGLCTAAVSFSANATDNCGGVSYTYSPASGSDFSIGITTVTVTAEDSVGNATTCDFNVTVIDNEIPVIKDTPTNMVVNNDPRSCDAVVTWPTVAVSDNCNGATISSNFNSGDTFPLGTTTVTYTASDANGNEAIETSFTVTVEDTELPTITCHPDITVDNDSGICGAIVNFTLGVSDNCSDVTAVASPASGTLFNVGTTVVTITATDAAGNTNMCTFEVTVEDVEAPIIDCIDLTVTLDDQGNGNIDVEDFVITNGSTDNCEIESISLSETSFDCSNTGGDLDELIISEYVDGSGNNDWIEIYNGTGSPIVLGDDINGNIISFYGINIYADGSNTPITIGLLGTIADREVFKIAHSDAPNFTGINSNFGSPNMVFDGNDAIALTNNGIAVDVIGEIGVNPGSGWTSASNSTNATTLVRSALVQQGNVSTFLANLESEWLQFTENDVTNLGNHYIEISNQANNVILTVTDIHGNIATCEGSVTVVDTTLPEAICQDVTVLLNANGLGSTTAQAVDNGSNDACGISLALSQTQFTSADIGANEVTLTVTDSYGNSSTCTAAVTVIGINPNNPDNDEDSLIGLDVDFWPNPSDDIFNIKVGTTNNKDLINIKVFDSNNRMIHRDDFNFDKVYQFGDRLQSGVYIVQIQQGQKSKTIRLVKY